MRCPLLLQICGAYFNNDGYYSGLTNCVVKKYSDRLYMQNNTFLVWRKHFIFFFINFDAGATLRYGLFRQVNCFRPSCSARQERNHSEKVSEREWRRVCISRSRCFSGRNFPRLFRGHNRCSWTLQRIFRRLL